MRLQFHIGKAFNSLKLTDYLEEGRSFFAPPCSSSWWCVWTDEI